MSHSSPLPTVGLAEDVEPEPAGIRRSAGGLEAITTGIPDVYLLQSTLRRDDRGAFFECYRDDLTTELLGYPVQITQANYSISHRGVVRGIHSATTPPGQAKIVSCVRGSMIDIAVDLRLGSPTFAQYRMTPLNPHEGSAVYLGEGIGHAFVSTAHDTCVSYLCSTTYVASDVITVDVFDPEIGLPILFASGPVLSPNDSEALSLAENITSGRLPTFEACRRLHRRDR